MDAISEKLLSLLPLESRAKLLEADAARTAAHVALVDAQDRLAAATEARGRRASEFRGRIDANPGRNSNLIQQAEAADKVEADRVERASAAVATMRATFRGFYFVEHAGKWLSIAARHRLSLHFIPLPSVSGQDHSAAVQKIRAELAELDARREEISNTPASAEDLAASLNRALDALASEGRPAVDLMEETGAPVDFHAMESALSSPAGAMRTILWLLRDQLDEKLHTLVAQALPSKTMASTEREAALAKINTRRLDLERQEEAHIVAAAEINQTIARRRDVDPRAFLQLVEA